MNPRSLSLPTALLLFAGLGWCHAAATDLVFVEGGTFKADASSHGGAAMTVASFHLGRHEVTQREWTAVMGSNPSQFKGDELPVESVSWYECVEYCNRRSLQEGLTPYYTIDRGTPDPANLNEFDDVKWKVTINPDANGYRLPTEREWEYAARGGQQSKGYRYSGSNEVDAVAWYWQNSGEQPLAGAWNWPAIERNHNQTQPVGSKQPNELGLHDMSGNVREWCWDWYADAAPGIGGSPSARGAARVWKGGGWMGGDFCCETSYRSSHEPNGRGPDQGFRVCRNS